MARIVASSLRWAKRFHERHPIGGAALRPLWAQLWSAAQGGSGGMGGAGAHLPPAQRQSRPFGRLGLLLQRQSACSVISAHGCGGGGGGGSEHFFAAGSQLQRGLACLSTAASHAVALPSLAQGVGGGAGGGAPVMHSSPCETV